MNVLILDKTGTITYGNRMADAFIPVKSSSFERLVKAAYESSIADDTPEGRSIVKLAYKTTYRLTARGRRIYSVYSETRMSGVKFTTREVYKGAPNSMVKRVKEAGDIFQLI